MRKIAYFALGIAIAIGSVAGAQAPAATVPVPAQLQSAKTVFLGLTGHQTPNFSAWVYTNVYQALAKAGYTLTPTPGGAELTIEATISGGTEFVSEHVNGAQGHLILYLAIYDAKTRTQLWSIGVPVGLAIRNASLDKNIAKAAGEAIDYLTKLASGTIPQD